MSEPIDVDLLPPTQYLLLEILAARHRLDEPWWTFPDRVKRPLATLQDLGLVSLLHGLVEKTVRASLTELGRASAMSDNYRMPADRSTRDRSESVGGWSLELARRRTATERAYQKLADDCWRDHDYLTAIRWRGVVEGLQIARDHHLDVLNPKDEK